MADQIRTPPYASQAGDQQSSNCSIQGRVQIILEVEERSKRRRTHKLGTECIEFCNGTGGRCSGDHITAGADELF
jgi:hypothetical protein